MMPSHQMIPIFSHQTDVNKKEIQDCLHEKAVALEDAFKNSGPNAFKVVLTNMSILTFQGLL